MRSIVDVRLQMDLSRGEFENRISKWKQCAASGNGGKTKFCSTRPKCAIKILKSGGIFTTGNTEFYSK